MRIVRRAVLAAFLLSQQLHPQASTTSFLSQVTAKYPGMLGVHSVALDGSATWTAGSLRESGSASLQASSDGSSSVQLTLDTASRTERHDAFSASRKCQWTDNKGAQHDLQGPDCRAAIPWFAPVLFFKLGAHFADLLSVTDEGLVTRGTSSYREISAVTNVPSPSAHMAKFLTDGTRMNMLFDPETLLPASVEYSQHSDRDWSQSVKVRVAYSDYQTVSGVPVPYRIDKYVNGVLQLSVIVSTVSVK